MFPDKSRHRRKTKFPKEEEYYFKIHFSKFLDNLKFSKLDLGLWELDLVSNYLKFPLLKCWDEYHAAL